MPQILNAHVPSLNAQRNLNTSHSALATALQRLSSKLRINSAKDAAAGPAIPERSRIRDADLAAETAALTRAQILQQAGTATLAQADASPNIVLTLLR